MECQQGFFRGSPFICQDSNLANQDSQFFNKPTTRIHGTGYIYLHLSHKNQVSVGKYAKLMNK